MAYVRKPKKQNPTPEEVAQEVRNRTRKVPTGRLRKEEEIDPVDYKDLEQHQQDMITNSKERKKSLSKARRQEKKVEPNMAKEEEPKKVYDFDDVFRVFTWEFEPVSIPHLADKMVAYARKEIDWEKRDAGGFSIEDFCYQEGFDLDSFNKLVSRHPRLQRAKDFMMSAIGERRDKGAMMRAYDGSWVAKTIGFYSPRHVSEQNRLAKLQSESSTKEAINLVVTHHTKKK